MAKILRKARDRLNARRNDHARTIAALKPPNNPLAYRAPGSMKKK